MKTLIFAKRNLKELIRDPLSLIFSIGLPIFLLVIFQQFNIPSEVYKLENFAPGIIIFSYGFISLFTGLLISSDRISSFLTRLYASPMKPLDFIFGYTLAIIPISIIQSSLLFIVALCLGLEMSINILLCIIFLIPISILFVSLGILIGSSFSEKTSPGASSIIVQLVAFTSGMWFDVSTVGNVLGFISRALPFSYAVDITRYILIGEFDKIGKPLLIILIYIVAVYLLSIIVFKKKMVSDNK